MAPNANRKSTYRMITRDLPSQCTMNVLYIMTTSSLVPGFAIARQLALTPSLENFCYLINNTAFYRDMADALQDFDRGYADRRQRIQ